MGRRPLPHVVYALSVATLGGLVLAGCVSGTPGNASPATTSGAATTHRAATDEWWRTANVCGLLARTAAAQLGFANPGQVDINSDAQKSCDWDDNHSGENAGVVLTSQRYDDLAQEDGQLSDITINGRPGKQEAGSGGDRTCDLTLKATKGSRVLIITALTTGTTDQACQLAQGVARAIEPELPRLAP